MEDGFDNPNQAVHSDFLVHWTGKDIDQSDDQNWLTESYRSSTSEKATERYIARLKDILTYGLWMTEEPASQVFSVGANSVSIPPTAQCCFTELKLSESRRHAIRYGRLGIGVKRPFLFNRHGKPVTYFGYSHDRNLDRFLEACATDLRDKTLLNFFKPMNRDQRKLTYDYYSESEWRLLFVDELLKDKKIINPRDSVNVKEHAYFRALSEEQQERLKYLVPLDGWFAMIIYPSLSVKNAVQWDNGESGARSEIARIKREDDPGNRVEGLKNPTRGNWPIEVNLDACRHF